MPCSFDCVCNMSLMRRTESCLLFASYLAEPGDVVSQEIGILKVYILYIFFAQIAVHNVSEWDVFYVYLLVFFNDRDFLAQTSFAGLWRARFIVRLWRTLGGFFCSSS